MERSLFGLLPAQGSDLAAEVDLLYAFLTVLSIILFIGTIGAMVYFAIAYRNRPGRKSKYIAHNYPLEIIWTVIPTIIVLGIFVWGWVVYRDMVTTPPNAYEVKVIGKQWSWTFLYPDGRTTTRDLIVPSRRPTKLIMSSDDVLHDFFIPDFRVKMDVVPGMYTSIWFEPKKEGHHIAYCAEYCGTSHSAMLADVWALTDEDWEIWSRGKDVDLTKYKSRTLALGNKVEKNIEKDQIASAQSAVSQKSGLSGRPPKSLAQTGKELSRMKGCVSCHSANGTNEIGPTFKGLYGKEIAFTDGSKQVVDDNYLRESIENPQRKIVKGFSPVMPTFRGLLNEMEMAALVEYIKSLK